MKINNKEEFENFYPYNKKYIDEYPEKYPCICWWETEGGGLMGEYKQVYVAYFPENVTIEEAFLLGFKETGKPLK